MSDNVDEPPIDLCTWAMPADAKAGAGLLCCLEANHEGRHHVYMTGRTYLWVWEVDERRRILIRAYHAMMRSGTTLTREEVCSFVAYMRLLSERGERLNE